MGHDDTTHRPDIPDPASGHVSLEQAAALALQTARDNPEFYGEGLAGTDLVWEVVGQDETFTSVDVEVSDQPAATHTPQDPLSYSATYFWRVRAMNEGGWGEWSEIWLFTVAVGTATEADRAGIPTSYALHANYPNPFNPTTTIQIELPETANITLAVYDVLGQEVLRLESGTVSAGRHRYTVDASTLPSGVYLYRLETPAFTQSRRMMLLK